MNATVKDMEKRSEIRAEVAKLKPELMQVHDNACYVCSFDCVDILHIHHVISIAKGGTNAISNLVLLCPNCHALIHKLESVLIKHSGGDIDIHTMPNHLRRIWDWVIQLTENQQNKLWMLAKEASDAN